MTNNEFRVNRRLTTKDRLKSRSQKLENTTTRDKFRYIFNTVLAP